MKKNNAQTAYTAERQDKYFDIEDSSWWFQYRIDVFTFLGGKYFDKYKEISDIGGSNGYNAAKFQDEGYRVRLIEPTEKGCENAKKRGVANVTNSTLQDYEGDIEQFLLLDVAEHISDDRLFLNEINSKLVNNGRGIISVPADMRLWSSEDDVDGHYRRYNEIGLKNLLEGQGFNILYINYMYHFLWFPIFVMRHLEEKLHIRKKVFDRTQKEEDKVTARQFIMPHGIIGLILNMCMIIEKRKIQKNKKIRKGSSIVCVVEKAND